MTEIKNKKPLSRNLAKSEQLESKKPLNTIDPDIKEKADEMERMRLMYEEEMKKLQDQINEKEKMK